MAAPDLLAFAGAVAAGDIEVVDLTQTLTPEFPRSCCRRRSASARRSASRRSRATTSAARPGTGTTSRCGEHTGTHFDAPVHWISGQGPANNSVDTIPAANFIAPAA